METQGAMVAAKNQLACRLTFTDTTSLVIGTILGTGIFLKTAVMAQQGGTPQLVLAAWALAGILSLAGALTYTELGAMFPEAGGDYNILAKGLRGHAGLSLRLDSTLD